MGNESTWGIRKTESKTPEKRTWNSRDFDEPGAGLSLGKNLKYLAFLLLFIRSVSAVAQQATLSNDFAYYSDQTIETDTPWDATLTKIAGPKGAGTIDWVDTHLNVRQNGRLSFVDLEGKTPSSVDALELNGQKIDLIGDGIFKLTLGFPGKSKTFTLSVHDRLKGNLVYRFSIDAPKPVKVKTESRFHGAFALGVTQIQYKQTRIPLFTEKALNINGALTYTIMPKKLDLVFSGFLNAFVLNSSSKNTVRFMGLTPGFRYHASQSESKVQIHLNGAIYYNTTIGNIGFVNMMGPQLYPDLVYHFTDKTAVFTYVKYSPVLSNSGLDFKNNSEFSAGIHYLRSAWLNQQVFAGIDYSASTLTTTLLTATASTVGVSVGVSF